MQMDYPTVEETASRVVAAYQQALACEQCDSERTAKWYTAKRRWIREHKRPEWTMEQACTIYAVQSTNSTVPENDVHFLSYVTTGTFKHFGDVIRRAGLASFGRCDLALEYKNGRKVVSFAKNLQNPRRKQDVTIDRHAADIGTRSRKLSKNMLAWSKCKGYEQLADGYKLAAAYLSKLPLEIQATTWVHHVDCSGGLSALAQ